MAGRQPVTVHFSYRATVIDERVRFHFLAYRFSF